MSTARLAATPQPVLVEEAPRPATSARRRLARALAKTAAAHADLLLLAHRNDDGSPMEATVTLTVDQEGRLLVGCELRVFGSNTDGAVQATMRVRAPSRSAG